MADFTNTAPAADPFAFWREQNPEAFANQGVKAGDPGTYQDGQGNWYGPSGQQIFTNTAAPQSPAWPTTQPSGAQTTSTQGGTGVPQTIAPFSGVGYPQFTPPPLPASLQQQFQLPSAADLQASPGYQSQFEQGLQSNQRSAAAQGSLLNGGTQKALNRYGQDYASTGYNNLVNQSLATRQQQASDYLNLAYGPQWQENQGAVGQYNNLYGQYKDLISNNRNAYNDYYGQQLGLAQLGLGATTAGNPNPGVTGSTQ